jgi:1-acyl-sn-glycerol-3-phosphate acyltransferase
MRRMTGYIRITGAILFTLVMAIVALIAIPFNHNGHWYHRVSRWWSHILLIICGLKLSTQGTERLVQGQTYIYVTNHASLLDIPVIVAGIPGQIRIVYKKELQKIPLFGWGLKWGSYIGIDRGRSAEAKKGLDEAIQMIHRGASVLLYAEGTRTLDGKLQPFKRGAFNLAVSAGIPVVPLTINGTFSIMPKGSLAIRPQPVELIFEEPIPVGSEQGKEAELRLMEKVHAAIAKHYVDQ